jgi:flagellar hook-associated protein 2
VFVTSENAPDGSPFGFQFGIQPGSGDVITISRGANSLAPSGNAAPANPFRRDALELLGLTQGATNSVNLNTNVMQSRFMSFPAGMAHDARITMNEGGTLDAGIRTGWENSAPAGSGWVLDRVNTASVQARDDQGRIVRAFGPESSPTYFVQDGAIWREVERNPDPNNGTFTEVSGAAVIVSEPANSRAVTSTIHEPVFRSTMEINGATINIYSNDTINNVMNRINANAARGATLTYDAMRGTFSLTARNTGIGGTLSITGDASGFLTALGIADVGNATTGGANANATRVEARNAIIAIYEQGSSTPIIRDSETNSFNVNGMTIALTGAQGDRHEYVTPPSTPFNPNPTPVLTAVAGDRFTIDIHRDVTEAMDNIRAFVDAYNEMLQGIHAMFNTARPRSGTRTFFEPLTPDQRNAMSDREIERWEEQARTGLLHRDSTLSQLHRQLRNWMFDPVHLSDGTTLALHQIGITTGGGTNAQRLQGLLQIDEDRLRAALENNPDSVMEMFQRSAGTPASTNAQRSNPERVRNQGLGNRLNDIILNTVGATGSITTRAGTMGDNDHLSTMSRELRRMDNRMDDMNRWLQRRENHFFAMFARMEAAMAQSNSQMDALFMFGAM